MCDMFKSEFKLANFGVKHNNSKAFTASQWRWHPAVFLTYRIIVALYVFTFFVVNVIIAYLTGINNILAFLTIWTYFLESVYFLSAAGVTIMAHCNRPASPEGLTAATVTDNEKGVINVAYVEIRNGGEKSRPTVMKINELDSSASHAAVSGVNTEDISNWMKFMWVLGNIVQVCAIIVSVVYFTALFPLIGYTNFVDINFHGMNTVFILIDSFISARPVRLLHVIYPMAYGLLYIAFSAVYWSFDHVKNVLYPGVLDWNYPGYTLIWVAALAAVGMPLLQLMFYGLYRLRLYIYSRCYGVDF